MNDYFTAPTAIPNYTPARASNINDLATSVQESFDKVPSLATFSLSLRDPVGATGTVNALVVTYADPITSYEYGQVVKFEVAAANTNSVTINVDGLGVKALVTDAGEPLVASSLRAGGVYEAVYDGTVFQLVGGGGAYAAAAAKSVTDAAAQVELAKDQVALAAVQVTAAEAEADAAQTFSVSSGLSAAASAASAAAAAQSAKDAALFDPTSYYTKGQTYSKAETDSKIAAISGSAPAGLDSIEELAAAIGNDPTFSVTVDARFDLIEATGVVPVGSVFRLYTAPRSDYLVTDGSLKLKASYSALYTAMFGSRGWPGFPASNPASLPAAYNGGTSRYGIDWQPGGGGRFTVAETSAPYVENYLWNAGVPTKLAALPGLQAANHLCCAWSPNGRYVALGDTGTTYVQFYDWNTGSPVLLTAPAAPPAGTVYTISWSSNSRYAICGNSSSPYMKIYDLNTGNPVKITDPATMPNGIVYASAFSPNGRWMVIGGESFNLYIYDWQTGSPVKIADPVTSPASTVMHVSFSADSRYFSVVTTSGTTLIYDMNTNLAVATAFSGPSNATCAEFSPDGTKLAVGYNGGNRLNMYSWSGGVATLLEAPYTLPGAAPASISWSPDSDVLAVMLNTSPYVQFFWTLNASVIEFPLPTITTTNPPTYIKALP